MRRFLTIAASAACICPGAAERIRKDSAKKLLAPDTAAEVKAAVQKVIDELGAKFNVSYQFGFVDSSGSVGLATGVDDAWTGKLMTPTTRIPVGSVTKAFTAFQVLQAVQDNKISLEDLAITWIDDVVQKECGKGMKDYFGDEAAAVTIRDLLGMTSGFGEYQDITLRRATMWHNADDYGPCEFFGNTNAAEAPIPMTRGGKYNGNNYILLGYVLMKLQGKQHWYELDQTAVFPLGLKDKYKNIEFATIGQCSKYKNVAHQYAHDWYDNGIHHVNDMYYKSCLNGWTMGNILATAEDLANFWYDVFTKASSPNEAFVNEKMLEAIQADGDLGKSLRDPWCLGRDGPGTCKYGIGFNSEQLTDAVWHLAQASQAASAFADVELRGHLGVNWGSGVSPCGYNKRFGFGICMAYTSSQVMRCDKESDDAPMHQEAMCKVYDAVLSAVGGPRLDCRPLEFNPHEFKHTCHWTKTQCDVAEADFFKDFEDAPPQEEVQAYCRKSGSTTRPRQDGASAEKQKREDNATSRKTARKATP